MINANSKLPRTQQCQLLNIQRSSTYCRAKAVSNEDLATMNKIDGLHLDKPFLGSRRLTDTLKEDGNHIGRNRVVRLMRLMGIQAIYPKPRTTERNMHPVDLTFRSNRVINHSLCLLLTNR